MKIGKALFSIALTLNGGGVFATTPSEAVKVFDDKMFVLNRHEKINNLFGEIKFSNLSEIIENKVLVRDSKDVKVFFYWMKTNAGEQIDFEVTGNISKDLRDIIANTLKSKMNIFLGNSLKHYLGADELEYNGKTIKATDSSADESNERLLDFQANKLQIIERKPSGTITTNYIFKESEVGNIVESLEQTAYEGIQATEIKSKLSYKNILGMPMLAKIETNLEQRLFRTTHDDLEVNRQIFEIIEFDGVEANTDKVLNWFSRK